MVIGVMTTDMGMLIETSKMEMENVDGVGELFLVSSEEAGVAVMGEVVAMAVII